MRRGVPPTAALLGVLCATISVHAQGPASGAGMTVAKLEWGHPSVERTTSERESWQRLRQGDPLRTGDRVRTVPGGVARLDFPWMMVTLGPSSVFSIPPSAVLSTVLEKGRAEFSGPGRDIVKIQLEGGEIRGGGRLVLWREGDRTAAAAVEGSFRVTGAGKTVEIQEGQGTSMTGGEPPAPAAPLPEAPSGLVPGGDPLFVPEGTSAEVHWTPSGAAHHLEVLALRSDDVLLARNVGTPPVRLEVPWRGTFRWRVSARDGQGLESVPSSTGYLVVVEK